MLESAAARAAVGLILCDLRAPMMNGFDVLLSSSELEADKKRAADLGATGYLVKMPAPEDLAKIITATCV